ncbi:Pentatricopeptide repeat-containing protein At2g13600, partial [Linum grandiflorum]
TQISIHFFPETENIRLLTGNGSHLVQFNQIPTISHHFPFLMAAPLPSTSSSSSSAIIYPSKPTPGFQFPSVFAVKSHGRLPRAHHSVAVAGGVNVTVPEQNQQSVYFDFSCLNSCSSLHVGKMVHAHSIKIGFGGHESVNTKLLQMYRRCGCLQDAQHLFDKMPLRNLFAWTAIIGVHLDHGKFEEAISYFEELLLQDDVALDSFVFSTIFKVCSGLDMLELGWQLHGMVIKFGFHLDVSVGNALIDTYGKCGSLEDAVKVLEMMPNPDTITWNSLITACAANGMVHKALTFLEKMQNSDHLTPDLVSWSAVIGGFAQNGFDEEAIDLLSRMQAEGLQPNSRTVASVLPACARLGMSRLGKELHGYIVRHGFMVNTYVVNGLVNVYRRCSDMESAHAIFSKFAVKNRVSYNTMIAGYCETGAVSKAMQLFDEMELRGIRRSLISWNSMIAGYVDNYQYSEGLSLFKDLMTLEQIVPDSFTLGSALTACANMASLRKGKEIHSIAIARGLQSDAFVGAALVDMYCACQDIMAGQLAFDEVIDKDITTWNALIFGYASLNDTEKVQVLLQEIKEDGHEPNSYTWNGILECHLQDGNLDSATQLLSEMHNSKFIPDAYTVGILLGDCSKLATLERGKQTHGLSIRRGYDSDLHTGAALVDMYAKCGSIKYAMTAYSRIPKPNLVSHNAMLTAYAMHGYGVQGISLFQKILETGYRPDEVTFLSALCSCVHAGSVEMGRILFVMMENSGMKPTLKHFTAMVDLLSRSGKFVEAYELIKRMPMEADSVLWGALLGGCVIHGNVEIGEIAARKLFELEPEESGNYVMLANLYAYSRRWSDLDRTRNVLKERGLHKTPGCSWIEDREEVHTFLACDISHKRADEIYFALDTLALHMRTRLLVSS